MPDKINPKSIKMIATDLDGTLLREDKSISDYTRSALSKCRASGIKLAFATGRGTAFKVAPAELFDGGITNNGAIAKARSLHALAENDGPVSSSGFFQAQEAIVYNKIIPYQTARPILVACHEHGIKIVSQASVVHYSNFAVSDIWPWVTGHQIVDFATHCVDAEKLYTPDITPENIKFIENLLPNELYSVVTRDITGDFLQIMHWQATKGKAVLALARHWNILPTEIAAFGNDLNDIDMLSSVGFGVAVANAQDEVKAAAGHGCGSNEEDGLAAWLLEHVLE